MDALDLCALGRDTVAIRSASFHSLIVDLFNDGNREWMIVYARLGQQDTARAHKDTVLGPYLHGRWTLSNHSKKLLELYTRDRVDPMRLIAWGSDGASNMRLAAKLFAENFKGFNLIYVHCINHRIGLSINSNVWKSSKLFSHLEEELRASYNIFSRSHVKKTWIKGS